jgi:hypothetical protein
MKRLCVRDIRVLNMNRDSHGGLVMQRTAVAQHHHLWVSQIDDGLVGGGAITDSVCVQGQLTRQRSCTRP